MYTFQMSQKKKKKKKNVVTIAKEKRRHYDPRMCIFIFQELATSNVLK